MRLAQGLLPGPAAGRRHLRQGLRGGGPGGPGDHGDGPAAAFGTCGAVAALPQCLREHGRKVAIKRFHRLGSRTFMKELTALKRVRQGEITSEIIRKEGETKVK